MTQDRHVGVAFQATYRVFQALALFGRRGVPALSPIDVDEGPSQPHHRRLERTRGARAGLVEDRGQHAVLEAVVPAVGPHERSHGLGGLEEGEEAGGGDLANGYERRTLPCFGVGGEAVGQVGDGGHFLCRWRC